MTHPPIAMTIIKSESMVRMHDRAVPIPNFTYQYQVLLLIVSTSSEAPHTQEGGSSLQSVLRAVTAVKILTEKNL